MNASSNSYGRFRIFQQAIVKKYFEKIVDVHNFQLEHLFEL